MFNDIFYDSEKIGSYLNRDITRLRSGDDTDMRFYRKIMVDESITKDFYKELKKQDVKYHEFSSSTCIADVSICSHAINHIRKKEIEMLIINTDENSMQFMNASIINTIKCAIEYEIPVYVLIHITDHRLQLMRKILKEENLHEL